MTDTAKLRSESANSVRKITNQLYGCLSTGLITNIQEIKDQKIDVVISLCQDMPLCVLALASENIEIISNPIVIGKDQEELTGLCVLSALSSIFTTLQYKPSILLVANQWPIIAIVTTLYQFMYYNTSVQHEFNFIKHSNSDLFDNDKLENILSTIDESFLNRIEDLGDLLTADIVELDDDLKEEDEEEYDLDNAMNII